MNKFENNLYETPSLKVLIIELEQGIASASITSDSSLDDWGTSGGGTQNGDFQ